MNILKIYNDTYWSLINVNDDIYKRYEYRSPLKKNKYDDFDASERASISRTKRRIKEICLCNDFQYFVTMTVSSKLKEVNRFDLENCVDSVKKIMHKLKRKSIDFKFLFIVEKHKNGAYHFHGLMKDLPSNDIYVNKNGYLSSKTIDSLGFNSFSKIKDYNKTCNYIMKYITKDCCRTDSGQIYFCSRGLKKPHQEFMIPIDLTEIFSDVYNGEYCQKKDFDISRLSDKEKRLLNDYFAKNDSFFQNDNNCITNWLKLFTNYNNYDNIKIIK